MKFEQNKVEWTTEKLIGLANSGKLVLLPHQRDFSYVKGCERRFVVSAVKGNLVINFIMSDLQSCLDYAIETNNQRDIDFFSFYINLGYEYSIEDGNQRTNSAQRITEKHFESILEKEQFLKVELNVTILRYCSHDRLVEIFSETNAGKKIETKEKIWGIDNVFADSIKDIFTNDKKFMSIFGKKITPKHGREFYYTIVKILKICGHHDKIHKLGVDTNEKTLTEFIKNSSIENFEELIDMFYYWLDIIKTLPDNTGFVKQSNLFFILHILYNLGYAWNEDEILGILNRLTDTRTRGSERYNYILKLIKNEK